jgi:hypothetical protein
MMLLVIYNSPHNNDLYGRQINQRQLQGHSSLQKYCLYLALRGVQKPLKTNEAQPKSHTSRTP